MRPRILSVAFAIAVLAMAGCSEPQQTGGSSATNVAIAVIKRKYFPNENLAKLKPDVTTQAYESSQVLLNCDLQNDCYEITYVVNVMPSDSVAKVVCKWRITLYGQTVIRVEPLNTEARTLFSDNGTVVEGTWAGEGVPLSYVAPDRGTKQEKSMACDEANRLIIVCKGKALKETGKALKEVNGYNIPLPELAESKEMNWDPSQQDCNVASQWKNYCEESGPR